MFAKEGAKVVVTDLDVGESPPLVATHSKAKSDSVAASIVQEGGVAVSFPGDITQADFPDRLVALTIEYDLPLSLFMFQKIWKAQYFGQQCRLHLGWCIAQNDRQTMGHIFHSFPNLSRILCCWSTTQLPSDLLEQLLRISENQQRLNKKRAYLCNLDA
jgi:hypothetical protein